MEDAGDSGEADRRLRLEVQRRADGLLLHVAGELDVASCDALRSVVDDLSEEQVPRIVIDLSDLAFTDSTGLGVLVRAHKHARASGTTFAIACPRGQVRDLFKMTGLVDALHVLGTAEEAWAIADDRLQPRRQDR